MCNFKIGDKVRRNTGVFREVAYRTGIHNGDVYTVRYVGEGMIQLVESKEPTFNFAAEAFSLVSTSTNWDVNEALRLRDLAVQAIQEYNTYLLRQPLLEAIDIPLIK
uniref:Nucleotide kinase n=1 Tax=Klebsiella phage Hope TaxID=3350564 RepID=A0AB74UJQ5_9CAUD